LKQKFNVIGLYNEILESIIVITLYILTSITLR